MTPAKFPLNLYRGDTAHYEVRLWGDVEKTQPLDLTGVTAKAQIRNKPGGDTIVEMTCTVVLPNIVMMVLPAAEARSLPSRGDWDLELTHSNGDVVTVLAGKVTVTADVTNSSQVMSA